MLNKIIRYLPSINSLRNRAILFSVSISLLLVIISVIGYSNYKAFYAESSMSLEQRDKLVVRISAIRGKILDSYKELNNFLLTPENTEYQKTVINSIEEAILLHSELSTHIWIKKYQREEAARSLTDNLLKLKIDIEKLINVRNDVTNQFPSLAVGDKIMAPNRNRVNNFFALAINEATDDNLQTENPIAYSTLIQLRHLWTQVLSNFRLYLANRVGSFNKNALPIQENAIEVMFNEMQVQLIKFNQFAENNKLGFETSDAIPVLKEATDSWFEGFKQVKIIHHSDEWRHDAKIMKETVSPRIDEIVDDLISLESIIFSSSQSDLKIFEALNESQNKMLWMIVFLGLFFTVTIVMSLDKLIFKPIVNVSDALKFEALGKKSVDISFVKMKEIQNLITAFSEMSYQVSVRQNELEHRALHDSLTALPNRALLLDRIKHGIVSSKRSESNLSLLIIDLDNFKEVNDTLGHMAGDNLLIEVGERIKKRLRDVDTVARIGGDEFSVLLPHTNEEQAITISKKVLACLKESISIENVQVSISASIGITVYPHHGDDVNTLLRHADIAMYVAKRHKLGFEVYNQEQNEHSITRLSMTKDFRDAIENQHLTLHFQPIYDLNTDKIVSLEALSRWNHAVHGYVSPEKFVALAEQSGLINELTYWVLNSAVKQISLWHKINNDLTVAVNLSVYSFKDPNFITEVNSILNKYNFPSSKLKLEITESAMMENPIQAIEMLSELHDMGVQLSIDDFGTGFSSMTYLKRLPVDELKIDKSFVIELEKDESNDAIVRSTIDLAHNLGLKVVAEGVETKNAHNLLRDYKCNMAQGYYMSRPIAAPELEELLIASR